MKNNYIILVVGIMLIFIIGCGNLNVSSGKCEDLNPYLKDECYYDLALRNTNIRFCYKITDEYDKEQCEKEVSSKRAITKKDEKACYETSDFDYDVADCVIEVAKAKQDESLCEDLPDWYGSVQQECFKEVAILKKDIKLCEKTYGKISAECYREVLAQFTNPEEICLSLNNASFINCYPNIDCTKSVNKERCEKVIDDAKNNPSLCEYEEPIGSKLDCYSAYAIRTKSLAYCYKGHFVNCVSDFALVTNDISVCDMLDYSQLHTCYRKFNVSMITKHKKELGIKDIEECLPFMGDDRDRCYLKQAKEQNDSQLCEESGVFKGTCYEEIAIATKNPDLCEKARDDCYYILAKDLKNRALCGKIKSKSKQNACYSYFWELGIK